MSSTSSDHAREEGQLESDTAKDVAPPPSPPVPSQLSNERSTSTAQSIPSTPTPAPRPPPVEVSQTLDESGDRWRWNKERLLRFLQLCQQQVNEGVLINNRGTVVKTAMTNVTPDLLRSFPGYSLTTTYLFNKYKALSTEYRKVKTLIKSGVGYDNETGIIEATDEAWETFIKRHKDLRKVRNEGFPFMDEMALLWPAEIATGSRIVEVSEANDDVAGDEVEELSVRPRKKRKVDELDPDLNPTTPESSNGTLEGVTRSRKVPRGAEAADVLGGHMATAINSLIEGRARAAAAAKSVAPRSVGSDDVRQALEDCEKVLSERLGDRFDRIIAKLARLFAKEPLEAVAWLGIRSVGGKEEFLRDIGILE